MNSLAVVTIEMIDVNNNAPVFSQPLYEASIEENHLAEYFVYQVICVISYTDSHKHTNTQMCQHKNIHLRNTVLLE